ncbi:hypothetical protein B0H17DRAFT_1053704 [Mycena rosella]|uniref:Cytochrome c oxidase assembly protein n=1 Tax=Mycena rosella TaxID=1033263 RepID=A0AAD7DQ63_MYCRO|nr:hypothetical protein B0H17DRAFT_1053704 [Mycena rosella]
MSSSKAKATLGAAIALTTLTIWAVHFQQEQQHETMYKGVLRDDERRRQKMEQRGKDLEESRRKRELYEKVQPVEKSWCRFAGFSKSLSSLPSRFVLSWGSSRTWGDGYQKCSERSGQFEQRVFCPLNGIAIIKRSNSKLSCSDALDRCIWMAATLFRTQRM